MKKILMNLSDINRFFGFADFDVIFVSTGNFETAGRGIKNTANNIGVAAVNQKRFFISNGFGKGDFFDQS